VLESFNRRVIDDPAAGFSMDYSPGMSTALPFLHIYPSFLSDTPLRTASRSILSSVTLLLRRNCKNSKLDGEGGTFHRISPRLPHVPVFAVAATAQIAQAPRRRAQPSRHPLNVAPTALQFALVQGGDRGCALPCPASIGVLMNCNALLRVQNVHLEKEALRRKLP
jgi:hypothetical protein